MTTEAIGSAEATEAKTATTVIDQASGENWQAYNADCVEVASAMPDRSVDLSVFSPPFASLYTYSNSPRDMGNVKNDAEFFAHFGFLVAQLARVMKPGRVVAMHCMDMPAGKERDGFIGLRDFPGELIRAFERHGFHFHSRFTIWKDPVTAMQRTKALGLLHKTVRENASMSRTGIPDYVVAMRAPGDVPVEERVRHSTDEIPVSDWQQIASPVWAVTTAEGVKAAIDPQDTLQYQSAREHDDERHICPLQLEVIRRCIMLWTNPGEVVFSPYMGIGSEGHIAVGGATRAGRRLEKPRKFIGAELKGSYYRQAVGNLRAASSAPRQTSIFDILGRSAGSTEPAGSSDASTMLGADGARVLRETLAAEAPTEKAVEIAQETAERAEEPVKPVDGPASARLVRKATKAAEKAREKAAQENPVQESAQEKAATAQPSPAPAEKPKRARKVKPSPAPEPTGPVLSGATVRVKIAAASWSVLSRERRADLTLPMDGIALRWEEGDGVVCADVPAEALNALRGMGEAHGVEVKVKESAEKAAQEGEAA